MVHGEGGETLEATVIVDIVFILYGEQLTAASVSGPGLFWKDIKGNKPFKVHADLAFVCSQLLDNFFLSFYFFFFFGGGGVTIHT